MEQSHLFCDDLHDQSSVDKNRAPAGFGLWSGTSIATCTTLDSILYTLLSIEMDSSNSRGSEEQLQASAGSGGPQAAVASATHHDHDRDKVTSTQAGDGLRQRKRMEADVFSKVASMYLARAGGSGGSEEESVVKRDGQCKVKGIGKMAAFGGAAAGILLDLADAATVGGFLTLLMASGLNDGIHTGGWTVSMVAVLLLFTLSVKWHLASGGRWVALGGGGLTEENSAQQADVGEDEDDAKDELSRHGGCDVSLGARLRNSAMSPLLGLSCALALASAVVRGPMGLTDRALLGLFSAAVAAVHIASACLSCKQPSGLLLWQGTFLLAAVIPSLVAVLRKGDASAKSGTIQTLSLAVLALRALLKLREVIATPGSEATKTAAAAKDKSVAGGTSASSSIGATAHRIINSPTLTAFLPLAAIAASYALTLSSVNSGAASSSSSAAATDPPFSLESSQAGIPYEQLMEALMQLAEKETAVAAVEVMGWLSLRLYLCLLAVASGAYVTSALAYRWVTQAGGDWPAFCRFMSRQGIDAPDSDAFQLGAAAAMGIRPLSSAEAGAEGGDTPLQAAFGADLSNRNSSRATNTATDRDNADRNANADPTRPSDVVGSGLPPSLDLSAPETAASAFKTLAAWAYSTLLLAVLSRLSLTTSGQPLQERIPPLSVLPWLCAAHVLLSTLHLGLMATTLVALKKRRQ